jgi:hypothetical protein
MTAEASANKIRYTGRIIRTANRLRGSGRSAASSAAVGGGGKSLTNIAREYYQRFKSPISLSELQKAFEYSSEKMKGVKFVNGLKRLRMSGVRVNGQNKQNPGFGQFISKLFNKKPTMNKALVTRNNGNKNETPNNGNGNGNKNETPNNGNGNKPRGGGFFNTMFSNTRKSIEKVLTTPGLSNEDKLSIIKELLRKNTKRSTSNKMLHISGLTMNSQLKTNILKFIENSRPPTTTTSSSSTLQKPSMSVRINSQNPLNKIIEILNSTNTSNSSKAQLIMNILEDNPRLLKQSLDVIRRSSSIGRNVKDDLIEDILEKIENQRNKNRNRNRVYRNRNRYFNNSNNNNRNVGFRRTLPVRLQSRPNPMNVLRSSNFRTPNNSSSNIITSPNTPRGGNNIGFRQNFTPNTTNNNVRRNNFANNNVRRNNFTNNNVRRNNTANNNVRRRNLNFVNTVNYTNSVPSQRQRPQQQIMKTRPVKMKLLKQTVEDVKKNKLIKQIKKLGKVDGFKVITQRKNDIVKYIVKQIRPPYKKSKKSAQGQAQLKENNQILFKNTVVAGNYGTRNENIRKRNAQNTGGGGRNGYTSVAS